MLGQRRRRWAKINPTLGQRLVFAGSFLGRVGDLFQQWAAYVIFHNYAFPYAWYQVLKTTTRLFALSDHYILSQE